MLFRSSDFVRDLPADRGRRLIATALASVYATGIRHQHRYQQADLPIDWRQRDIASKRRSIRAVDYCGVEVPTPEFASAGAAALGKQVREEYVNFEAVRRLGGGAFFEQNGLLFLPTAEVGKLTGQFQAAAPLLEVMAGDPSLRGLTGAGDRADRGQARQFRWMRRPRPLDAIAGTVETVLDKGNATFLWREQVSDKRSRRRPARLHRGQSRSQFRRAGAGEGRDRRHPQGGERSRSRRRVRRAGAPDRPVRSPTRSSPPFRRARGQRHRHHPGGAVSSVAGAASPKIIFAVFVTLAVGLALTTAFG